MVLLRLTSEITRRVLTPVRRQGNSCIIFPRRLLLPGIRRRLIDDHMRLRPLRIFDGSFMSEGLRSEHLLKATGLHRPIPRSWFNVWWWLKKTYPIIFCIEIGSKRIGFLGLCNMDPGESAEASLVIFNSRDRRLGYGTRAFTVLLEGLRRYPLVKRILVRVKADNHAARSFWTKLGFEEIETTDETRLMAMAVEKKL